MHRSTARAPCVEPRSAAHPTNKLCAPRHRVACGHRAVAWCLADNAWLKRELLASAEAAMAAADVALKGLRQGEAAQGSRVQPPSRA